MEQEAGLLVGEWTVGDIGYRRSSRWASEMPAESATVGGSVVVGLASDDQAALEHRARQFQMPASVPLAIRRLERRRL